MKKPKSQSRRNPRKHVQPRIASQGRSSMKQQPPRVCKKELRSPGIPNIAGVADLQAALTAEAAVPPTLPTSPTSASKKRTPRSSRRKRGSSRTPKDRTPEANFEANNYIRIIIIEKTPETKPSSRTPEEKTPKPSRTPEEKAPEEEPSTRTPDEKAPEKPSIRTPKDKAPEKPSSRTPKEKAPEKPSIRTPKEKAPEAATPKARTPCSGKRQKSKSPAAEKEALSFQKPQSSLLWLSFAYVQDPASAQPTQSKNWPQRSDTVPWMIAFVGLDIHDTIIYRVEG